MTTTTLSVSARFDADWRALVRRPATASLLKQLAASHPGFPIGGPDALVDAIRADRSEQLIRQMVTAARRPGEPGQIAARIVLQALRPLAVRLARSNAGEPFADAHGTALAAIYQAIRTVPTTRAGSVLANVRMDAVNTLYGARRRHHPAARRAIEAAVPDQGLVELATEALHRAAASAEEQAITAVGAERALRRARAAGLHAGDARGDRVELLELLLWAVDEHVITHRQAELLSEHGDSEETEAAGRARRRAIARLREASARYLAAQGS